MIFRLVALLALLLLIYWALTSIVRKYALGQRQAYMVLILGLVLTVIVVLILLGRLPIQFILAPLGVAFTYLLRMLPTLLRLLPLWHLLRSKLNMIRVGSGAAATQVSRINTIFLAMELHHGSGDMDGKVLRGTFQGQRLAALTLEQLVELGSEIASDHDSIRLLEAYLDRMHPAWRESAGTAKRPESGQEESAMTRSLALEILGLVEPVTGDQVVQAHRRLMQKLHPDRGGSDYLAKKINAAREYLDRELNV